MPEPAPLTDAELAELGRLCAESTQAPLLYECGELRPPLRLKLRDVWLAHGEGYRDTPRADADGRRLAAAWNALPRLLAELLAARAELARRAERPG